MRCRYAVIVFRYYDYFLDAAMRARRAPHVYDYADDHAYAAAFAAYATLMIAAQHRCHAAASARVAARRRAAPPARIIIGYMLIEMRFSATPPPRRHHACAHAPAQRADAACAALLLRCFY